MKFDSTRIENPVMIELHSDHLLRIVYWLRYVYGSGGGPYVIASAYCAGQAVWSSGVGHKKTAVAIDQGGFSASGGLTRKRRVSLHLLLHLALLLHFLHLLHALIQLFALLFGKDAVYLRLHQRR